MKSDKYINNYRVKKAIGDDMMKSALKLMNESESVYDTMSALTIIERASTYERDAYGAYALWAASRLEELDNNLKSVYIQAKKENNETEN